ncbi:uncharacterized protein LOC116160110 [Photinus pyralis]|uniref:HAUS augmin-like complex subunit 6 N-terminal domain-containing protein n=1 Tax=Photinus pyralis TaxID=7054 RepID=A0A1Y1N8G4_PHOPY|nr:uncharacterized protein LOC116160110 [Photinus pyralis]
MALKIQKEFEMRIHEQFYTNVHLLTFSYPPSEAFTAVFKKDMFVKNNKVGFQQVTYYLLDILDKNVLKQKIPTWPLYDVRSENEFRNEIMKYMNELNGIYEDANIPIIATSHLIMPGGLKFIKFMCKLSMFVLYQHLQRNNVCPTMLLPLQPSKRDDIIREDTDKIVRVASTINKSVVDIMTAFNEKFDTAKVIAHKMMSELCATTDLHEAHESKLALLKEKLSNKKRTETVTIGIDIPATLKRLRLLKEKVEKAKKLNSYLESPLQLSYNGELSSITDLMRKVRIENNNLNLTSLLDSFNFLAEQKCLEVKPTSEDHLKNEIERFRELNKKLECSLQRTDSVYDKSIKMLNEL